MENMGMNYLVADKPRLPDIHFWRGKRVFLTGHTGFKGGWMSVWLAAMGAKVTGYSLTPNTSPNFFNAVRVESLIEKSYIADIRDHPNLSRAIKESNPDVLIHMAAQPLVRYSYANPMETFSTNIMGTVNVLEASRLTSNIRSIVVVTTDKCYQNQEWIWGYRENEPLGGNDPYSSSKACAELVTNAYRQSFFKNDSNNLTIGIASARAGNVIGGGDWSPDRLIPDALSAFEERKPLILRNPLATRPWQHVLESLSGYLILAQALHDNGQFFSGPWNFGPEDDGNKSVEQMIEILCSQLSSELKWILDSRVQPHEANLLKLDCSKAHRLLGWKSRWSIEKSIKKIVEWHQEFKHGKDMRAVSLEQIEDYLT